MFYDCVWCVCTFTGIGTGSVYDVHDASITGSYPVYDHMTIKSDSEERPGPGFCLLLGVSSDHPQPITGQVTEVTCPVIGWAQSPWQRVLCDKFMIILVLPVLTKDPWGWAMGCLLGFNIWSKFFVSHFNTVYSIVWHWTVSYQELKVILHWEDLNGSPYRFDKWHYTASFDEHIMVKILYCSQLYIFEIICYHKRARMWLL